jgi:hypothetical protein
VRHRPPTRGKHPVAELGPGPRNLPVQRAEQPRGCPGQGLRPNLQPDHRVRRTQIVPAGAGGLRHVNVQNSPELEHGSVTPEPRLKQQRLTPGLLAELAI